MPNLQVIDGATRQLLEQQQRQTDDVIATYEAALAHSQEPSRWAALGCALARAGRLGLAVRHLGRAIVDDPMDLQAARALFHALGELGDVGSQRRLAHERRCLAQADPEAVPEEDWFLDPPPSRNKLASILTADKEPRTAGPARVSLCMIVKNEEAHQSACLESAADLFDEIIVVDTGSTDRTKEIAAHFGARVFDFPWVDSFAAARNEGLRHATGDWIFWLDADDRLNAEHRERLRRLFAELTDDYAAYVMKCVCLPDGAAGSPTVVDHVRLFRNHPELRWRYRVHEQILPAVRRLNGDVRWVDIAIHHVGYQDPALRGRKLERDLRLLQLELVEQPDDPFTLFNLGAVYQELGQPAAALPALRHSLELSHPGDSIVRKLYALIVQCHRQLNQPHDALAACRAGRRYYPDDVELLFLEGSLRRELGDANGAEACLLHLLQVPSGQHFASVDAGLRGYKARHLLALLYHEQGRWPEAASQWETVLAERPEFLPAWRGLAEVYRRQERWSELEIVRARLGSHPSAVIVTR